MKIVNVSGNEDYCNPNKVFYMTLDQTEFDRLAYEDVEISSSAWDTEEEAIEHCREGGFLSLYIARVEIVAKTV